MKLGKLKLFVWVVALMSGPAQGGQINAAVAANFTAPMRQIAAQFQQDTGHTVKLSFGSSGKFYAQIKAGAPFDVFLSADEKKPVMLEEAKLAVPGSRFVYALGKLVLWSAQPGYVDDQGAVLENGGYRKIALADPKLAPYGLAAQQTLQKMQLWEKLQGRLVMGESIAQTYQFVASGNAELGFVALSQVMQGGKVSKGSSWLVPAELYDPIKQVAVQLSAARDQAAAAAFLAYLKSARAQAVIRSFGYGLPRQEQAGD